MTPMGGRSPSLLTIRGQRASYLFIGMKKSMKNESSDNYFECCGGGAGCPVMVAYEGIWRYI